MHWKDLKAELLAVGSARLTGEPAEEYIARSTAGPGAGGSGAVFFAMGSHRVKFGLSEKSEVEIAHRGDGVAHLYFRGSQIPGTLLKPGCHCPDQAFITVTGSCIFRCRYCPVPLQGGKRKTIDEIMDLVESVRHRITAISLTSGVLTTVEEEETYVIEVVKRLRFFGLPIGVSIYPTDRTAENLKALGVEEVKFNLEAATSGLFAEMCPGLDYDQIWRALEQSVRLFGRGRVFSNVLIGLGETDEDLDACIRKLTALGVIPVLRPLNPVAGMTGTPRPSAERLKHVFALHEGALAEADLDPKQALTMCSNCAGCDLVPGRDE